MAEKKIIVTDCEADESLKSLATGKLVPAVEFSKSYRDSLIGSDTIFCDSSSKTVNDVEIRLLRAIIEHPIQPFFVEFYLPANLKFIPSQKRGEQDNNSAENKKGLA